MLKNTLIITFTISTCTIPSSSLAEEECYSENANYHSKELNAENFSLGPNNPHIKKIEKCEFLNKVKKLEIACLRALQKILNREKEIKEAFTKKYNPLEKKYAPYLNEVDNKKYNQARSHMGKDTARFFKSTITQEKPKT